jgi:hypothetical protein
MLTSCKLLAPRIQSFNEINLDFYFFNDSVFHLGKRNTLPMFKLISDEEERSGGDGKPTVSLIHENPTLSTHVTEMANRLFTVCAVHREYPYI